MRAPAGAVLVAGLVASGVVQLPTPAVAASQMRAQVTSVIDAGTRVPAVPAPVRIGLAPRPRLFVGDDTVFEGDDARFDLRLSTSSRRWVTVHFITQDGSAEGGTDYEQLSGKRSFRPGSTRATISVETFDDARREGDQTFFLRVFGARGATRVDSFGRATIIDRTPNNPPCHPKCPPPCHPHCPPPCHPHCPPPCHPHCPPPCHPHCPPPNPPQPNPPPPPPPEPP
ncbi:Calx-beta domain-containing protein, partial [Nocardioides sp.]|uniref:Calx-beta domain-containing protein n=1 Tax=Nocardioides sp. TaxID=35761 RepID=UPI002D7E3C4A